MTNTNHAVVVVIRIGNEFVLVQEAKESVRGQWSFPGGMSEPGESIIETAVREAKEESGLLCKPARILKIEHRYWPEHGPIARIRWILAADFINGSLKSVPDSESLQAKVFSIEEISKLTLREAKATADWIKLIGDDGGHPIESYNFETLS